MKEKSVILVEFTGKEKTSGKIFDTTNEKIAKENGLYRENALFQPVPVIVGNREVLQGMDEALLEMKVDEEKIITLQPEKAFGERKKELIEVIPVKEFTKRKINPFPGLIVDLNNHYGKVQTVSSGRVRVDMNPELAGKEVEYTLKITQEITNPEEKAQFLTNKFFPLKNLKTKVKLTKDTLTVEFPKEVAKHIRPMIAPYAKVITEVIPEIKKVEVAEPKEEKEPTPKKEETEKIKEKK